MTSTLGFLLALSFIVSLVALGLLIWAVANKQISAGKKEASSIFLSGEAGALDDPSSMNAEAAQAAHRFDVERAGIDAPGARVVLVLAAVSILFLIAGSVFGVIASFKLHMPDWLADYAVTTFGRARTIHLNFVAYG